MVILETEIRQRHHHLEKKKTFTVNKMIQGRERQRLSSKIVWNAAHYLLLTLRSFPQKKHPWCVTLWCRYDPQPAVRKHTESDFIESQEKQRACAKKIKWGFSIMGKMQLLPMFNSISTDLQTVKTYRAKNQNIKVLVSKYLWNTPCECVSFNKAI